MNYFQNNSVMKTDSEIIGYGQFIQFLVRFVYSAIAAGSKDGYRKRGIALVLYIQLQ
jgi:hypothetical protein